MAKTTETTDYTKMFKDMMSGSYFDTKSSAELFTKANEYGAKFSKIALDTFGASADLSNEWVKDSLKKMDVFTKPESEPTELVKKSTDALTEQMQAAPEYISKFAEIAKSAQIATTELMMEAGTEARESATAKAKEMSAKAKEMVEDAA